MVTEFILLGFGDNPDFQIFLFFVVLFIYMVTMVGNILIVALVVADQHLHTPMYYFLGNLSCLETFYSSTILPRMLASFVTGNRSISFISCFLQMYFFGSLAATECFLLSAMSYDRYLAICKPLHYTTLMNNRDCLHLIVGSWISGFLGNSILFPLLQLTFCGRNDIDHFFCDFNPLLKLSCSDTHKIVIFAFIIACIFTLPPFLLTLTSYVCIITTILRIPSSVGRQKAFSTCSSHLIVVTIFYGTLMIVYMMPKTQALGDLNKVFSAFYTILTPMVNPLIYSLRNKEVKQALKKVQEKIMPARFLS
ncbi:PREDICTED: olfactory receptor 1020-like [Gekko japonicus]|uniref:Olfactory receptor n=1 Tax=Gekko japonicus TaxID=146911 RepID=A0ABM1JPK0_GEKJA|nr:PREDICTED: olfactory receptor 1020-like [Gekko japonicus]